MADVTIVNGVVLRPGMCALCVAGEHMPGREHNLWCVAEIARIRRAYPVYGSMPCRIAIRLGGLSAKH